MKSRVSLAIVLSALFFSDFARAEIGAIDAVPAATLLLPYFEVGLESCVEQPTTLFSVNNASQFPVVAHVTLWTKLARPSLDFDIFLTGYDVFTVNLADLFLTGSLLQTGPGINGGPGAFSQPNFVPAGCTFPLPAQIPPSLLTYIRNLHTGFPAPPGFSNSGLCGAPSQGITDPAEGLATGYITIDVVNDCSLAFPGNPGYFVDGGAGIATNANVLWGDYFLARPTESFAQGDTLVHIEAIDSVASGFWNPGDYTFYGRYLGFDASDNREPLATTWATRYFSGNAGPFTEDSDVLCWRDSGLDDSFFFDCGTIPAPYPLTQNQIVIFDEEENPVVVAGSPFSPPPVGVDTLPCSCATTRADAADFGDIFDFGWFFLNLNTSTGSLQDPIKQSYVSTIHSASGQFSVGFQAMHLDSALAKTFTVTTFPADISLGPAGN
ncbi:MAG: hypothetical protein K0U98_12840 [Deltaproteobacteria bacterium]|nr:hypothetical protein [Deltaproteobacteria bacterium]